jgi:Zn finger protein HypA/HybF involved in hydrogenase expression
MSRIVLTDGSGRRFDDAKAKSLEEKTPTKSVLVSVADYEDATASSRGGCTVCHNVTRDTVEPDVDDYDCPACESPHTVMGAENALLFAFIELEGGLEDA